MKILVFTDVHGNKNVIRKHKEAAKNVDLVLFSGDITFFGHNLGELLELLEDFPVPVFLIHGNHEDEDDVREYCSKLSNVRFIHKEIICFKDWFIGAYATSGLGQTYPAFEEWANKHRDELLTAKPLIWLDHAPPFGTTTDDLGEDWHVGSLSLRDFIEEFSPRYVFCGHIHESFGCEDILKETIVINSGPTGRIIECKK